MLLSFIFQNTLLSEWLRISGIKFNLIIPLVVYCGYQFGKTRGIFSGLILGGIQEILCSDHLGIMTLSYGLIGGIAGLLAKRIIAESWFSLLVGTFIATLIEGILISFVSLRTHFWYNLWAITLPSSLYNLVAAFFIFWIFRIAPKRMSAVQFEEYQTPEI